MSISSTGLYGSATIVNSIDWTRYNRFIRYMWWHLCLPRSRAHLSLGRDGLLRRLLALAVDRIFTAGASWRCASRVARHVQEARQAGELGAWHPRLQLVAPAGELHTAVLLLDREQRAPRLHNNYLWRACYLCLLPQSVLNHVVQTEISRSETETSKEMPLLTLQDSTLASAQVLL